MNKIRPVMSEILDCKGVLRGVTDLFGRACICCGGCTIVVLRGLLIYLEERVFVVAGVL